MLFRPFYIWLGLIVLLFAPKYTFAQEVEITELEELLFEQLSEELSENVDVSDVFERLSYYLKKPINLNIATASDLSNLVFLSPQQVSNLLYHRQVSGDFISVLELQSIVGFSTELIKLLIYFVTVEEQVMLKDISLNKVWAKGKQSIMFRYGRALELAKGYKIEDENRSRYLGDPNRYALRYRLNYEDKVKISFNAEKDAGEPFFKDKQRYGFDFYSGHIEFNNVNKYIRKVVVGDYALQFNQGLVLWNGLSFGKGAWIGSVAKQASGLRGYSSLNETNFQRGLSANIVYGKWDWTPFIAFNALSGNVIRSDSTFATISTISSSGLHRTPTELSYKNQVKQLVYGSNLGFQYKRLKVGITYLGMSFNGNFLKGNAPRNTFDFEGSSLHQIALAYQTTYRNYFVFGELAHSFAGGFAIINGVVASLHPALSLFTTYRYYGRNYYTFYGQSIGENSTISNEKAIYTGISFHPNRKFEWINYIDIIRFPWLKFRIDAPSNGLDFFSQVSYSWYKKGKVSFRYRFRMKQENSTILTSITNLLADVTKHQFRIDWQYKLTDNWNIRTRAELVTFQKEGNRRSNGFLCYQDVFWKGIRKLQFNWRGAFFNTTDYDSRIYAYENDVLYASSFPVYYDKGIRSYLNLRWRISKRVNIWSRYALSYFFDKDVIGSGLDEIEGKVRSDIKLQIRWEW